MALLYKRPKKPKTAAQFAAARGARVPLTGNIYGPKQGFGGIQQQINQGVLDFNPLANLGYKAPVFTGGGGFAPRGGGILKGGRPVVPKAPSGQWWVDDYQVREKPEWGGGNLEDLANRGILNFADLEGLGINRRPISIAGSGSSIGLGDIEGDFEFQAALRDIAAANAADAAAAGESIEALATGWGGDLSGLVKSGLISQRTADVAGKNQFSTMSELGRALKTGTGQGIARLAARGMLSSGALPAMQEEYNRQYQRESTTGLQNLMSSIRNIRNQQAQAAAERQGMLSSVRSSIAGRLAQLPQYQQIPTMQAFWDAETGSYIDDIGRRFDQRGNRLS